MTDDVFRTNLISLFRQLDGSTISRILYTRLSQHNSGSVMPEVATLLADFVIRNACLPGSKLWVEVENLVADILGLTLDAVQQQEHHAKQKY